MVFETAHTLNFSGKLLDLSVPVVMGILNVTPDSFYAGSRSMEEKALLSAAEKMLAEGAAILDIGGASTRPGSAPPPVEEELARVIPAVCAVAKALPGALISVDTFRAEVARRAVGAGASMVNDISAGNLDPGMLAAVAALKVPYVLMHMQGVPATMQQNPAYEDVVTELTSFFTGRLQELSELGIRDVVLDPGFGFGKTIEHNYEILKNLNYFKALKRPLMAGLSRKSMVTRLLGTGPDDALNGTTALHAVALLNGASILRVHDVKEAVQVIRIIQQYRNV